MDKYLLYNTNCLTSPNVWLLIHMWCRYRNRRMCLFGRSGRIVVTCRLSNCPWKFMKTHIWKYSVLQTWNGEGPWYTLGWIPGHSQLLTMWDPVIAPWSRANSSNPCDNLLSVRDLPGWGWISERTHQNLQLYSHLQLSVWNWGYLLILLSQVRTQLWVEHHKSQSSH